MLYKDEFEKYVREQESMEYVSAREFAEVQVMIRET